MRTPSSPSAVSPPTGSPADGAALASVVPPETTLMEDTPPNKGLERTATRLDRMVRVPAAQSRRWADSTHAYLGVGTLSSVTIAPRKKEHLRWPR